MQESYEEVTWKGLRAGGMQVARGDLHLRMSGVQQCRVKRRCQLVVRLKANECYQELLRSLSSYINFLSRLQRVLPSDPCSLRSLFQTPNVGAPMPDLCVGIIGNVTSRRDAEAFGLIVFVLGSVLFFWYCSSIILTDFRVQAV